MSRKVIQIVTISFTVFFVGGGVFVLFFVVVGAIFFIPDT